MAILGRVLEMNGPERGTGAVLTWALVVVSADSSITC